MPNAHTARQPRGQDVTVAVKAAACRSWLTVEALITRHLGKTLSERAYRTFLFDLYLAELEQTEVFQSYFAADEAPANAHRRSARLARLGALTRIPDKRDHRRIVLRLAPAIRQSMDHIAVGLMRAHQAFVKEGLATPHDRKEQFDEAPIEHISNEAAANAGDGITIHKGKLLAGGRITLPLKARRSLALHGGETVVIAIHADEIRIHTARSELRRVR